MQLKNVHCSDLSVSLDTISTTVGDQIAGQVQVN